MVDAETFTQRCRRMTREIGQGDCRISPGGLRVLIADAEREEPMWSTLPHLRKLADSKEQLVTITGDQLLILVILSERYGVRVGDPVATLGAGA